MPDNTHHRDPSSAKLTSDGIQRNVKQCPVRNVQTHHQEHKTLRTTPWHRPKPNPPKKSKREGGNARMHTSRRKATRNLTEQGTPAQTRQSAVEHAKTLQNTIEHGRAGNGIHVTAHCRGFCARISFVENCTCASRASCRRGVCMSMYVCVCLSVCVVLNFVEESDLTLPRAGQAAPLALPALGTVSQRASSISEHPATSCTQV